MTRKSILKSKPCAHIHVSGRQCSARIGSSRDYCGLHKSIGLEEVRDCTDCQKMLDAFPTKARLQQLLSEVDTGGEF